ncbi:MAG: putative Na+/H+ antiporter [Pseudomonadota bacterium]|nr:putative Na+/H+ antiporter [Pseudomonadota bacterium]
MTIVSALSIVSVLCLISSVAEAFPLALDQYQDAHLSLWAQLKHRIMVEPMNLYASLIFLGAIIHTFFSKNIMQLSQRLHIKKFKRQLAQRTRTLPQRAGDTLTVAEIAKLRRADKHPDLLHYSNFRRTDVSFTSEALHFLGEVEAVFGIWALLLLIVLTLNTSWHDSVVYFTAKVSFTEAMFVVVIMCIASTRPILGFAGAIMTRIASLFGGSALALWLTIMTIAPVIGSFITEPAAMTIGALLLAKHFYSQKLSPLFRYGTLGLLFVNISVGGTFTNFAAPPVLMVAARWQWDTMFMISNFGWKALIGIVAANILYAAIFWQEFKRLAKPAPSNEVSAPLWITAVHLLFLLWTVVIHYYPPLFIGGFLFFLAFHQATRPHQQYLAIKTPLLVGFFIAGLVVHGGLQGWWIAPVLGSLSEIPLFFGAVVLTAFNDNAAITYLATLVPNFAPELKYAVVAGAVAGGGLTIIANAPNPAGQSILGKYFAGGVSPLYLLCGALPATIIMCAMFLLL